MQKENALLISAFIEEIWNKRNFGQLEAFLHTGFKDHSLPPSLPAGKDGLVKWITATGDSFEHRTFIEEHVSESDKCMVKLRMQLKHIGAWRGIAPTGLDITAVGYRFFKIRSGRIIEHWGLIDGQAIENQLKNASHGCKIAG